MSKELVQRESGAEKKNGPQDLPDRAAGLRKLDEAKTVRGQLPPGIKPFDPDFYASHSQQVKAVEGDVHRMIRGERVPIQAGDIVKPGQFMYTNDGATMVLFDPIHGEWKAQLAPDSLLQIQAAAPPIRKQKTQVLTREGSMKGGLAALDAASEGKDATKRNDSPPK
jgi:hypothetical protein